MGVKILGFGLGREDIFEPDESPDWGSEEEMLTVKRFEKGELEKPFAATEMGLIYVNPEGPGGNPDPVASAKEIRIAFSRMGMNDEETVAPIAGGHAFGKCHGASVADHLGKDPSSSPIEMQGLGWKYGYKSGKGPDTYTSGFEVIWSPTPTKFGIQYLHMLFKYEWELEKSPAGKYQWVAKDAPEIIPDAYDLNKKHKPRMLTADLAIKFDPEYSRIARKFLENPKEFERVFATAWFKLTHRDMGPKECYLGPYVPKETFLWQDPLPAREYELIDEKDVEELKKRIIESGLSISQLVYFAWASASTYRNSDRRGGANGARIRLYPINEWEVNHPEELRKVLKVYEKIKEEFDEEQRRKGSKKRVSIADLIVLGSCAAVEEAARRAGFNVSVPFIAGRVDASEEHMDVEFYKIIEPFADGFRNYFRYPERINEEDIYTTPEYFLVDKAQLLNLNVQELVVLIGRIRSLGANYRYTDLGVLTRNKGMLSNEFFENLLSMDFEWQAADRYRYAFNGFERKTCELKWKAMRVDLIIGHHDELRAVAEVYACDDAKEKFVKDFIAAWAKVMHLDRFDIWRENRTLYRKITAGIPNA